MLRISVCECACVCARALARPWVKEYVCVRVSACRCTCTGAAVYLLSCSLFYPAWHAQAPCCLRPLWLHHIFRHYLINDTIFGKKVLNIKCVFWFSQQHLFDTLRVIKINQCDIIINDALQILGTRGWRRRAENRDEWRQLLREAKAQKGLLCHGWMDCHKCENGLV
jgi:hypothetical protein